METLQQIAGKSKVCDSSNPNTGKLGCQIQFGTPLHLFKLSKGLTIPKETVFNKAYINSLIQKSQMIPIVDANSFEDNSSEDTYYTSSSGLDRLNLKGLPKYSLMFQEGHEFYKQMAKLDGYKTSDFLIGDDLGNIRIAVKSNGDYTGFTAGQVVSNMRKDKVQGGDPESKTLMVQFTNRKQWDEDYTIIEASSLDFDLIDIQGVNGAEVSFTSIPISTDTFIHVSINLLADRSTGILGISESDLYVEKQSSSGTKSKIALNSSAITSTSSGVYKINVGSKDAGDIFSVNLRQTVSSVDYEIIIKDDILYNSNTQSATVVGG